MKEREREREQLHTPTSANAKHRINPTAPGAHGRGARTGCPREGRWLKAVGAAVVPWLLCTVRKPAVWITLKYTLFCASWHQHEGRRFPSLDLGFRSSTAGAPGSIALVYVPMSIPWTVAGQISSGTKSPGTAGTNSITLLHRQGVAVLRGSIHSTYCHCKRSARNWVTCTSL